MFHIPTRLRDKLKYSDRLWPVFAVTVFIALAATVSRIPISRGAVARDEMVDHLL
jgi:hypothetical protein